jgi:NADH:ubiquinone oxidoreductase subunit E
MSHSHEHVEQPSREEVLLRLETPQVLARVEELIRRYPVKRAALLQVLWVAQETLGWVPQEAIRWAADKSGVSPVHAYGVSTFYTMYKKVPTGRFFFQICHNVCCHIQGSEDIIAYAEKALGISAEGGTTGDNVFSLLRVECLGACGNGPVMQVNDEFATDVVNGELAMPVGVGLNPERFDKIVAWCRERAAKLPEEPARDALGSIFVSGGHPGAEGANTTVQTKTYAPAPPALGVSAVRTEDGKVKLTWRAAPEVTTLHIEKQAVGASDFVAAASISGKDKEWLDDAPAGTSYRIVAESGDGRKAKVSNVAKVEA